MNRKHIYIAIISAFICCTVIVLFVIKSMQNNHGSGKEIYNYDSVDSQCNYSESNVLYLDDSGILHLIDTASGKNIIYCDKPNCTHEGFSRNNENPSCPAAFWGLNMSGAVLHNGHLYFVGNMENEDGLQTQYLYEMDSNGEKRKKVAELEDVQNVRYVLYRDNYAIGAYYNSCELDEEGQIADDNKPEAGIFVINLDNYKVHMSDKVAKEQANVTGIYYENGVVYYSVAHFGEDVTQLMLEEASENNAESFAYENMIYDLYQYNIEKQSTELLKSFDHIISFQLLENEAYYSTKDGWYVFDPDSKQSRKLGIDVYGGDISGTFVKNEDALYYNVLDNDGEEYIYCQMENGKCSELMRVKSEDSFIVENICGNSVYIDYTNNNGEFCLGVVNLDDYNNGKFEPRELRALNEDEEE